MKREQSLRVTLLILADELLSAAEEATGEPTVVIVRRGPVRTRLECTAEEMAILRAGSQLGEMAMNVLQALREAGGEVESKKLARLAGYSYSSRFRTVLRELQVKALVARGPDGYRLVGTTNPDEETSP
jgi:DNA-binding IclR family transcriptional regulator